MKNLTVILFLFFLLLGFSNYSYAASGVGTVTSGGGGTTTVTSGGGKTTVSLPDPLSKDGKTHYTVPQLIARVIQAVLGIVGSLALLMFIFGGLTWMTSAGSPDKVTKGKNILIWTSIGMLIIFTSYTLVKYVLKVVTGT